MNEKTYNTMKGVAASNIALGVIILVAGLVCGTLSIISGARLIHQKSDIIF